MKIEITIKIADKDVKNILDNISFYLNNDVVNENKNLTKTEQAIVAVCDEGLTFAEAAEKYDHMGDGERSDFQPVGFLVRRYIMKAVFDNVVIDNGNGTYSRAKKDI